MPERRPRQSHIPKPEQRAQTLLVQTFRFAQGNKRTQRAIVEWLVTEGYFDDIDLPENPSLNITTIKPQKHHASISEERRQSEIAELYSFVKTERQIDEPFYEEKVLDFILAEMIFSDIKFQNSQYPRPGRNRETICTPDSSSDPHASFVRKFILNRAHTGTDAFNNLHEQLAKNLRDKPGDFETGFNRLEELWEQNHPGEKFFTGE